MKKQKRSHGMNRFVDDTLKALRQCVGIRTNNNWRKMHGKPMRRKGGVY